MEQFLSEVNNPEASSNLKILKIGQKTWSGHDYLQQLVCLILIQEFSNHVLIGYLQSQPSYHFLVLKKNHVGNSRYIVVTHVTW